MIGFILWLLDQIWIVMGGQKNNSSGFDIQDGKLTVNTIISSEVRNTVCCWLHPTKSHYVDYNVETMELNQARIILQPYLLVSSSLWIATTILTHGTPYFRGSGLSLVNGSNPAKPVGRLANGQNLQPRQRFSLGGAAAALLDDLEVFARQMQWQVLIPPVARHVRLISPPSDRRIYSPFITGSCSPSTYLGFQLCFLEGRRMDPFLNAESQGSFKLIFILAVWSVFPVI